MLTYLEISLEAWHALVVVGVEHGDEAVPHVEHGERVSHHRRHVQHLQTLHMMMMIQKLNHYAQFETIQAQAEPYRQWANLIEINKT